MYDQSKRRKNQLGRRYNMDGWQASAERNFVRMNQSGALSYELANGSALSLSGSGIDGANRARKLRLVAQKNDMSAQDPNA